MMVRVKLTPTAEKQRAKLSASTRARIDAVLESLKTAPRPPGAAKLAGLKADWRIREGDYRLLYEIDDAVLNRSDAVVTVWRIAHRREAYQP